MSSILTRSTNFRKEASMSRMTDLVRKVEIYDGMKKFIIEVLVEVISGVILKLISGGVPGRQREPKWAGA